MKKRYVAMMLSVVIILSLSCGMFTARATGTPVVKTIKAPDFDSSFSVLSPYKENGEKGLLSRLFDQSSEVTISISESDGNITIDTNPSEGDKVSTIVIPIEFSGNETLELIKDDDGNTNGSCLILDEEKNTIGYILVKNDNVSGSIIENKIQLETTEPKIEVSANSDTFSTYFSNYSWGKTGDGYTKLALYHKSYLTSVTLGDPPNWQEQERQAKRSSSWSLIYTKFRYNVNFAKNISGMKNQYLCHFDTIGSLKNPWNLEVERPDPGYAVTVAKLCNPK